MRHYEIVIIGAGISGLSAASKLAAQGRDVLVLEKSRGVSGRAATRRTAQSLVDHGAQFFTARSENFKEQVRQWMSENICFEWARGFHEWREDQLLAPSGDSHPRHACAGGMSALGKAMAQGVNVLTGHTAVQVRRASSCWTIAAVGEMEEIGADTLIMSIPSPQALQLLDGQLESSLLARLQSIHYAPSLCVVVQCAMPAPEWRGIQVRPPHTLSWIADDTSRRRLNSPVRNLVLHGSADFSAEWQDRDLELAAELMLQAAAPIVGDLVLNPVERMVHRWRYALVTSGLEDVEYLSATSGPPLYFCGDAFAGAKIEGAWLSGQSVAAAV